MQDASAYAVKARNPSKSTRGAEWVHQMLGGATHAQMQVDTCPDPQAAIKAYVNQGRWVVDCPDCNNAQLACKTDPRFLCNECGNVVVGNLWRPVTWPPNVAGIETVLEVRPIANQNWTPGETIQDLVAENTLMGV